MKFTETRKLSASDLRNVCIAENWYTMGSNEDYSHILMFANANEMTVENIAYIATDIINHTPAKAFADCYANGIKPIEHVMYRIAEKCHSFFSAE